MVNTYQLFQTNQQLIDFTNLMGKNFQTEMDRVISDNFISYRNTPFSHYLQQNQNNDERTILMWKNAENYQQGGSHPDHSSSFIGIGQLSYHKNEPFIVNLTVNSKYQHQGYGGQIVKLLEKEAKRQGYSEIRLNIDFDKLRSFYQELGYREMLGITNYPPHIATYRKLLLTGGRKVRRRKRKLTLKRRNTLNKFRGKKHRRTSHRK